MYTRLPSTPTRSVFLSGPRGAGKSTWIRERFPGVATYDLLDTGEALRLSKDPSALCRELAALWDDVRILPLADFLKRLWTGEIIGATRPFS